MAAPSRTDLKIVTGSTTLELTLKPNSLVFVTAEPLNPLVNQTGEVDFKAMNPKQGITSPFFDFSHGLLRGLRHKDGYYYMSTNVDTRWHGMVLPGPWEAGDLTGIAANEKVIKAIQVGQDSWIITTTTVYRSVSGTGTWTDVGVVNGVGWTPGNPTDIVVFGASGANPIIAVAMGASTAYQTTINNGANWVASTKTANAGNAKFADFFCVASRGGARPKVWYVRNQNELYSTFDLTNGDPVGTTGSTIGDNLNDPFTSIIEDKNGVLLIGTVHALYTIDSEGVVTRLTPFYQHKATSDAGTYTGNPTRPTNRNFENPQDINGRIYYPIEDYRIGEWDANTTTWSVGVEPSNWASAPRLRQPILCMIAAGEELWVFLGSNVTSTTFTNTSDPGTSALLGNSIAERSAMFAGLRQPDGTWEWHGSLIDDTTDATIQARYAWRNPITDYLYVARAAQKTANNSQVRFFLPLKNPIHYTAYRFIQDASRERWLETGRYDQMQPSLTKTARFLRCEIALPGGNGSVEVRYRVAPDDATTVYTSLATYTSAATADIGTAFPASTTFQGIRLKFSLLPANTVSPVIFLNASLVHQFYPTRYDDIQFTVTAARGQVNRSGAMQGLTMSQVKTALEAWRDATDPATVTDNWTGDTWAMNLDRMEMRGTGKLRTFVCIGHEVR